MKKERREFLAITAVAAASGVLPSRLVAAEPAARLVVVRGTEVEKMLAAGVERLGGFGAIVKPGKTVTLKPNAAWARRPEQGTTTDPGLVGACVAACARAGASRVVVSEHPVTDAEKAFEVSGIGPATRAAGGVMVACEKGDQFREVTLPQGRSLTETRVAKDVLDAGCLINMPVIKHHGSTILTGAMKNWMGSVKVRGTWHLWKLEQKIADLAGFLKPDLIVADATRVLLAEGPRGPGPLAGKNEIVLGTDPVAVDAYGATLLGKKPFEIEHVKIAHEMGVGVGDLSRIEITRLEA